MSSQLSSEVIATGNQRWAELLLGQYPDPSKWSKEGILSKRDIHRFARLWLSEGIPYVFREKPIAYERGREQLAKKLSEDPKHFSMTGSARLGYSLSPKRFSMPFGEKSDLDLFAVSTSLFGRLSEDARLFAKRTRSGDAIPPTPLQQKNWPDNAKHLEISMAKGYIDSKFIPVADRYPTMRKISNGLVAFNMTATGSPDGAGLYHGTSLRVYRDWQVAMSQIGGSLVQTLKSLGYKVDEGMIRGNALGARISVRD